MYSFHQFFVANHFIRASRQYSLEACDPERVLELYGFTS